MPVEYRLGTSNHAQAFISKSYLSTESDPQVNIRIDEDYYWGLRALKELSKWLLEIVEDLETPEQDTIILNGDRYRKVTN